MNLGKQIIILSILLMVSFSSFSQKSKSKQVQFDTIKIVGPIADSSLFTIDSTLLEEKIEKLQITTDEIPQNDLYQTWNNDHVRINKRNIKDAVNPPVKISLLNHGGFEIPYKGKVISPFGYRGRGVHTGTDIKLNKGDSVVAAFDGVVRLSKRYSGYGKTVVIRHYNGLETVYSHLSKLCVNVNQKVKAGELIGLGGRTGRATTEHLHFETRYLESPFNSQHIFDYKNFTLNDSTIIITAKTFKMRSKPLHKKGIAAETYEDDSPASDSLDTLYAHQWVIPKVDSSRVDSVKHDSIVISTHKNIEAQKKQIQTNKLHPFVGPPEDTLFLKKKIEQKVTQKQNKSEISVPEKKLKTHTVAAKETFYSISKKYHITIDQLLKTNQLNKNSILSIGQQLQIPNK